MLKKIKSFKKPNKITKEIIINIEPLETRVAILENKNFKPYGQVLNDADMFDAFFWGINAKEARRIDPQQR